MKLTNEVLRKLIEEELTQASRKGPNRPAESPEDGMAANLGIRLGQLIVSLIQRPSVTNSVVDMIFNDPAAEGMGDFDGVTDRMLKLVMLNLTKELEPAVKDVLNDLLSQF